MKQAIEKLLPETLKAVDKFLVDDFKIASEYNGYISSFGASTIQMGLLPTIAVYAAENSGSKENKGNLLAIFYEVLVNKEPIKQVAADLEKEYGTSREVLGGKQEAKAKARAFFKMAIAYQDAGKLHLLRDTLMNISVATKLAIRTFDKKDKKI